MTRYIRSIISNSLQITRQNSSTALLSTKPGKEKRSTTKEESSRTHVSSRYEGILHEIEPGRGGRDVVKAVSCSQALVRLVVHHRARQGVIAHHVRQQLRLRILHDEAVDYAVLRHEPVPELVLREKRRQVEFAKVLRGQEQRCTCRFCILERFL